MTPTLRKTELPQPQVFGLTGISKCSIRRIEQEPEFTNANEIGFRKSRQPDRPSPMSQVEVLARL